MDSERAVASAEETAALLAGSPFAERLARGAATIVALGRPPRVLFANSAALTLFAAPDLAALEAHLFSPSSPGARRMTGLAEAAAAGPPRVESLRFWLGRRPLPLALLCGRIGDRLVLATPPTPDEIRAAAPPPEPQRAPPPRRFLWRLDGEERFGAVDPALADAFGDHAPQTGETLATFRARAGFDRDGKLADALAARRTFAALPMSWGEKDGARLALMSGAPEFDRDRRFAGWRGFGLFADQAAPDAPSAPPAEAVAESPLAEAAAEAPPNPPQEAVAPAPPVRPTPPAERSAEIVVLRPAAPLAAANVVPIRPGATPPLPPAAEARRGDDDNVELSSHERDAFREIARALGARLPSHGDDGAPRDLLDLAPPPAVEPAAVASGVAGANAEALLDLLPIGAMVLRAGEPLYLNRTLLELAGYHDLSEFRAADGLKRMFRGRDAQTLAESGEGGAIPLVALGGELIAVDALAEAIAWDGAPATLLSLRRSREVEYQERLRNFEREARDLKALLDSAADGVVTLDESGRVLAMSRGAEALFGYDAREVAGESFLILFAPQSQSEAAACFERARREEPPARGGEELSGRDRRGQTLALALTLARFVSAGAPARYCAALRDLGMSKATERALETARDAAEQANARKTEFLARVSHEVRTPLHAILGFAEVMMEERFGSIGNDRYKDYVRDIHASARHVMSLANDLLDLAKIEAGKLELEFAPVDANRVVRECVSLMQPQAAQERIIMRLSLLERLPPVMADERALRQILLNLLSNAVKFNEPGGQVIVSTALDEAGAAVIRVRDTGVGMNENEIAAALEPFRQVGDAAQRAGGAGLGLPLTKALAEANHADFSIKSRKQQGTLVEVAFPGAKAAQ